MNRVTFLIFLLCLFSIIIIPDRVTSQEIPHPVSNTGVYEFLDELAANGLISLNSAIKPYTRLFISNCLREADNQKEKLNQRQQKELEFYLKDFGKEFNPGKEWYRRRDIFYYKDSLFSFTFNLILGGEIFNNSAGSATYWRNGLEARAYAGKWGFYASLRDNHEKPLLGLPEYLTRREGGHLKGETDWSEMKGGVTWSWKWGWIGLIKDNFIWGNNYNGANIFGGRTPTFIQLRLNIKPAKWFELNYLHGWLNSMVVDSTRSYWVTNSYGTDYREVYHGKYIAANMFTITPFRNLSISAGNSIVYSGTGMSPAYLVPVFFYKSVDHSMSSGIDNMNSQMFFDVSSRQIRHLHLYATLFIDELSVSRISDDDEWNFLGWKAGARVFDLPVKNLSVTGEFTYSYPLTYQHYVPTLTFESNRYNLGHYLKDNSREWYFDVIYKPLRTLNVKLWFSDAIRGPDYTAQGGDRVGNPPLESIEWHNTSFGLKADYQLINDLYLWGSFTNSNISGEKDWTPDYFYGKKNTFNLGVTFGF